MGYAPWFPEIFCRKYSENQKWATPLITATTWQSFPPRGSRKAAEHFCRKKWSLLNFFQARGRLWKANSKRNVLRFVYVTAPHHLASQGASRRGCLWTATRQETQEVENKLRPSSVNYVDSFPPRGSLWNRLTIFAEFCGKQNEARGRLYQRQSF